MAKPNAQLESALAHFAAQPGTTPQQDAQLRAAIVQDARLLQSLNEDAANGQLKGFALSDPASGPNRVGTFDKASGVVALPAETFKPTGTAPDADLVAALRVQDMSVRFAHRTYLDANQVSQPVSQDMVTNLQATLNGSPVLAAEVSKAVTPPKAGEKPALQHFAPLEGTVAGGTYDPTTRTMSLPAASLDLPPAQFQDKRVVDLTFVLGHEMQHGFNAPGKDAAYKSFATQAKQIATDGNPVNDYTAPVGQLIHAARVDEAKAQIAGWNALLSRERESKPKAGLSEMYELESESKRVLDFVELGPTDKAQPRAGLKLNPDMSMAMTPANIETVGKYYFDKPPKGEPGLPAHQTTGLGFHGESDYPNYYGANAVSNAISVERAYAKPINGAAPQMHLNLSQLRLREDLMERSGIVLTTNPGKPQPYFDTSTQPPVARLFQHTADSHQHVNPVLTHAADTPAHAPGSHGRRRPDDPDHPDHALLENIREGVRGLDQQAGKSWDAGSDRLSASLLVRAAEKGFAPSDDIRIGFNQPSGQMQSGALVHVYRLGHPDPNPAAHREHVVTAEALVRPPEDSHQMLDSVRQRQVETEQRTQQTSIEPVNAQQTGLLLSR